MRRRLWLALILSALFVVRVTAAHADEFALPGLESDADRYQSDLERRHPAGASAAQRRAADQVAAQAIGKRDWNAAVAALEERVSLGEATQQTWRDLANAHMKATPANPRRALQAAWEEFSQTDDGAAQVTPLLQMVDALKALDRLDQAAQALQAIVDRAPNDPSYKRQLADLQKSIGLVVRAVKPEAEADPPRACLTFSVPPTRRTDFVASDWVRLDPPVSGAAITREGDQICVSGLPSGKTTRIILRAGLPGEGGQSLQRETAQTVSIPNRQPSIAFDVRLFVLPRGQAPSVTINTVNLSSISLKLMRLTERNVATFLRDAKLGGAIEQYQAEQIGDTSGRVVWQGKADIPKWEPNRTARTSLPIPDPLLTAGPGLYALLATSGDGSTSSAAVSVQMILRTDLAPTVWRGTDGLTAQIRGYSDAAPKAGVRLQLLARNNDILGETTTDAQGFGRFPAPLMRGEGPLEPAVLHAFGAEDDFAALDLSAAAFDLSDRGVDGAPSPGALDSFIWFDRGIYRPGETVQIMALLRDAAGAPADFPAEVTLRRPNGQVFLRAVPPRLGDAAIHLPVKLSAGAQAGNWTIEIRSDPKGDPIGTASFRVDAFVPDRMAVDFGKLPAQLVPGRPIGVPVTARFLYGAPGAHLTGKGNFQLVVDPTPFPEFGSYHFGLVDETYAPDSRTFEVADTDDQGVTTLPVTVDAAPDTTHPLKANVGVEIDDPSGHAARAEATLPVRSPNPLIGVKPLFDDYGFDAGSDAAFDIVALTPEGTRTSLPVRVRLVREHASWHLVRRGSFATYETVYRDEPLETRDVTLGADTPFRFAKRLDFGRYRLEVSQANGMAVTSVRFRSGWGSSDAPDVPDRVEVSTATKAIAAGGMARVHVVAPFDGQATVLVLSDRVLSTRTLAVSAAGTDIDVPVDPSWGPGAYVAVHAFRGAAPAAATASAASRPARAIGVAWIGVDPAARTLPMAVAAPDRLPPRARSVVTVHTAPGAWVTLAAVDEGILRLTRFSSPDPRPHFLGRRRLGVDIRDDWGRLIAPAEGEVAVLRQGGDDSGFALPDVPQKTVVLFTPPMRAGADGNAAIPLDMPDFNGQVRLMAVGWQGSTIGAANTDVIVRDALVVEPLLPRFLAPGDEARMAVLMHNLDLPGGEAVTQISVEGPLALAGGARLAVNLAPGAQAVPATVLRATGVGRGIIHLDITGPGGFHINRETAITIRPSRPAVSLVASGQVAPGAETRLAVDTSSFIPGTWRAAATLGAPVRYDAAALVRALQEYPLSCLEQATSVGFPLVFLPDGPVVGEDRAGRLQQQVSSVLDRQRFDGGFALWTAAGNAQPWLSSYAMEFLLRARKSGVEVPEPALRDGLKYLAEASDDSSDEPEARAAQAYRLYVLALGGQGRPGAARVLAENIGALPTPLSKAQLAMALYLGHDQPRAEAAFEAALSSPARRYWYTDYGSVLRDQAALAVLLKESGLLPDRLAALIARLPGADLDARGLSTQEEAWAAAAAGALGRDGRVVRASLDGRTLGGSAGGATGAGQTGAGASGVVSVALTGPATLRNEASTPLYETVVITGVPVQAPPASRNLMRVQRRFFNLDGSTLNLDQLKQNTVFVMLLEGAADDGDEHHAQLIQGLPAGWEIAAKITGSDGVPGMTWLGKLTDTDATPAADDRYAAVTTLSGDARSFRVAVKLRAVTPGSYEMPGAELSDMYRPALYARQGAARIRVQTAE